MGIEFFNEVDDLNDKSWWEIKPMKCDLGQIEYRSIWLKQTKFQLASYYNTVRELQSGDKWTDSGTSGALAGF